MSFTTRIFSTATALMLCLSYAPVATAQIVPASTSAQTQTSQAGKYAFLMFYKQNDRTTQAMAKTLKEAVAARSKQATVRYVQVGDPAQQGLVNKYGVARAPMPLTVAVAPNGATTGVFPKKLTAAQLDKAFLTPTMMFTMKSVQEGKLVLVSAHGSSESAAPPAIHQLQTAPEFQGRVVSTSMRVDDPQEADFAKQMQLDRDATGTSTVVIAPPGVLIGKFAADATKEQIISALANAGKCCDDPNCKHKR